MSDVHKARLAAAEAILRDIVEGWPNDEERFDRGIANAEVFLADDEDG